MYVQHRKESTVTLFKTEAVPIVRGSDKKNFHVGYFFDAVNHVNDLKKVVIKFPKKMIDHASCIKHLEITGHVNTAPTFPIMASAQNSKFGTFLKEANLLYPDHDHNQGWHGRNDFNATARSRRSATTVAATTTVAPTASASSTLNAAGSTLTALTSPPFLFDIIEAVVEGVEPCKPYLFTLKIVSPQGPTLLHIFSPHLMVSI